MRNLKRIIVLALCILALTGTVWADIDMWTHYFADRDLEVTFPSDMVIMLQDEIFGSDEDNIESFISIRDESFVSSVDLVFLAYNKDPGYFLALEIDQLKVDEITPYKDRTDLALKAIMVESQKGYEKEGAVILESYVHTNDQSKFIVTEWQPNSTFFVLDYITIINNQQVMLRITRPRAFDEPTRDKLMSIVDGIRFNARWNWRNILIYSLIGLGILTAVILGLILLIKRVAAQGPKPKPLPLPTHNENTTSN